MRKVETLLVETYHARRIATTVLVTVHSSRLGENLLRKSGFDLQPTNRPRYTTHTHVGFKASAEHRSERCAILVIEML